MVHMHIVHVDVLSLRPQTNTTSTPAQEIVERATWGGQMNHSIISSFYTPKNFTIFPEKSFTTYNMF